MPDRGLIDQGTIGIATYAMLFVIVALLFDRWMDRRAANRLADALNRNAEASTDLKMAMLIQFAGLTSMMTRVEQYLGKQG